MDDSEDVAPRQRAISPAVLAGREARELVGPVQGKLGAWQAEAIKLEVMAQRLRVSGRRDAGLSEAARTLFGAVGMEAEALEAAVVGVPPKVREHSRVADTVKVLRLLELRLEKTLTDLGEPVDKQR